ncbi:rfaE bifunctional protein nucleotidyltransferase chain/domain [Arcticibacter tournemirensis]|uniref:D-glycero-beta-D-manno-heptose 1-phosphate adenylyltransferase n=1 Tax=Arcticibacter tournemirensis TaxID=699437 RepID=A0A543GLZ5_9SPHI|nr:D-glycero-beta-D-manno-heptose 1-phosphate adenylyltransferase [Arcticibacter tournemirensis]KAA8474112.1 D-glycero-beta-D-manno-heptose 1-phosphate adenylyltransferase [Arcticibacter tournemirensis]TQM47106.1 rfaE bifunctional protein nucleotidyltransferase chain/domain [Arcticibacter tournemirensis]TQM48331.1 rfaE bifunctional protein nucleotidyltransferase chain/domain [Arcticibacter tournemirensis]
MDKLDVVNSKVRSLDQLLPMVNIWKFQGNKIVFTNGCFDLLHLGHIDYLAKAASMGNKLIIGVNTDQSVSELKGAARPITDQHSRTLILASLFFVDAVVLFGEATPLNLITAIKPDILVKGADYTIDTIVGADVVMQNGGEVKTITYIDGYSTTAIERKIREAK